MAERLGTIFVELDLDYSKFEKGQRKVLSEAKSTSLSVETNWRRLGAKSDAIYTAMANSAINAYTMIANKATTSAAEQYRAQAAFVSKINKLNIQRAKDPLYETLGTKSVNAINQQKAAILSSYNTIKASGTATAQDLVNIERAKNRKLKDLNREMVGHHDMSMAAMTRAVLRFYAAYYVLSNAMQGVFNVILSGIRAIDDLKISTIAVAAQLTSIQGTTGNILENYKENLKYAEALNIKLMEIDAHSFANFQQLILMNRALVGQGVLLDVNNAKQVEAFTALSNTVAMLTTGQDKTKQASQEIRALMSGQIKVSDTVARMIDSIIKRQGKYKGGLEEVVALGKQHGDVLERLQPYLLGVVAATGDIGKTWEAVSTSMGTALNIIQRGLFKDVYKEIVDAGQKASQSIKDNADEIIAKIQEIGRAIKFAGQAALVFLGVVGLIAGSVAAWAGLGTAVAGVSLALSAGVFKISTWTALLSTNTAVVRTNAFAVASLGMALKSALGIFTAAIAGYQIGAWVSNEFEFVRKAAVHVIYGIADVWGWFFWLVKRDWEIMKTIAASAKAIFSKDTLKNVYAESAKRVQILEDEYKKGKIIRAKQKADHIQDITDEAIALEKEKMKATKKVKVPEMPGEPPPEDKAAPKAKKEAERLAEAWRSTAKMLAGRIEMSGLDMAGKQLVRIRMEAEALIEKYKEIPGAVALIEKAQGLETEAVLKAEKTKLAARAKTEREKEAAEKIRLEKETFAKTEALAKERADIYRTLYSDLEKQAQGYYAFQLKALKKEKESYLEVIKTIEGKLLVEEWYANRKKELDIELAISSDDFHAGVKAKLEQMNYDILKAGQAGAKIIEELSESMEQSFSTIFVDAWMGELQTARDYFLSFTRSLAQAWSNLCSQMIVDWLKQKTITGVGAGDGEEGTSWTEKLVGFGISAAKMLLSAGGGGGGEIASQGSVAPSAGGGVQLMADGGVLEGGFRAFANGGVANTPTFGLIGEGRYNEAVIPLPDGKSVPVAMHGGDTRPEVKVEIANITSPELFEAFMSTPRGKNAMWNVISTNPGKMRSLIGVV